MTKRFFGLFGALTGLAMVSASCIDDPLADLDGAPAAVVMDYELLVQAIGEADTVIARVVDGRFTDLEVPTTYTACDGDIAVSTNASHNPVPPVSVSFVVQALTPGASCVVVSGGGVTDTLDVGVLPVAFGGAVSSTNVAPWDTITVSATTELQFIPDTTEIDFGGGNFGIVIDRSATSMRVVVPPTTAAQPAPLIVRGVNVTYVPGLRVDLQTAAIVTNESPYGDPLAPGGATITLPDTIYDGFPVGVVDRYFTFTLAAPTTFTVVLEWDSGADVDLLFCNAACSAFVGNFDGATGANPEVSTVTLAAGTYNIYINNFTPDDPAPLFKFRATP